MLTIKHLIKASIFTMALNAGFLAARVPEVNLTPMPNAVVLTGDTLHVPDVLTYTTNLRSHHLADLHAYLPSYPLKMIPAKGNALVNIHVSNPDSSDESYTLDVSEKGIRIEATAPAGAFYGLQTLAQLVRNYSGNLPTMRIEDAPRFSYRGVHIDVSRHFFDTDYIKKQLDMVASYKINRMHWHLTDGAGWRLQIPSRPRLTEFAAWRPQRTFSEWRDNGGKYCEYTDSAASGGYYTEADVKDVLEYARLRHITVIPEIEMPGHSSEVLAAYPELSCEGKPYVSGEVCIGNEETFRFFEEVLDEVIRLFPSHYIHIGGDEANRRHWKNCEKCQQRIKEEGLDGEDGLQSYMIERIERYINSKGRDIIGWDEILDGGLAPNATVMSWRGVNGGIKAAQQGHDAIMTPEAYCYLDHYQDDPDTQPLAFGSPVTIFQSYSFDPAPAELGDSITKHIIGVQGNNWAEYIPTPEHGEYMMYPRIIALGEVGWTLPENKDQTSFKHRINDEIRYMKSRGYNPFTLSEQVQTSQAIDYDHKCITLSLTSEKDPIDIRYTLDGSEPTLSSPLYVEPFIVTDSIILKARLFDGEKPLGQVKTLRTDYHKAIGKTITYSHDGDYYRDKKEYMAGGQHGLIDGLRGGKSYMDGRWQGFCPNNLDAVIDLGEVTQISHVMANFMQMKTPQVYLPVEVNIYTSTDGKNFTLLATDKLKDEDAAKDATFVDFGWTGAPVPARYVRLEARQGQHRFSTFLFTDEIVIQ